MRAGECLLARDILVVIEMSNGEHGYLRLLEWILLGVHEPRGM